MYDARPAHRLLVAAGTAKDCSSTGVATLSLMYFEPFTVRRLVAYVTTVMVSTGKISVQCLYRPIYGSATNQTTVGTLKIGATAIVDSIWYLDITPLNLAPGQLVFNVSVAATTSGAATFDCLAESNPEVPLNETAKPGWNLGT